jgi:hypothetical protein
LRSALEARRRADAFRPRAGAAAWMLRRSASTRSPGSSSSALAAVIQPGETIYASGGPKFHVPEAVPTEDEASEYVGTLTVKGN